MRAGIKKETELQRHNYEEAMGKSTGKVKNSAIDGDKG